MPKIDFLRLAAGSKMIDKGTDVGLPFVGTAPDLGAYEYGAATTTTGTGGAGGSTAAGAGGRGGAAVAPRREPAAAGAPRGLRRWRRHGRQRGTGARDRGNGGTGGTGPAA